MKELQIIKLKKGLPKYNLKKGSKGVIVMIYGKPVRKADVEFINKKTGKTIAVIQLEISLIEEARK